MQNNHRFFRSLTLVLLLTNFTPSSFGETKSVKETMDGIVSRLYDTLPDEELFSLTEDKIQSFLTPEERESLATQHVTFEVNVPVVVSIMHNTGQAVLPFWLPESGFEKTDMKVFNDEDWEYDVWQKNFDPGFVGLGINGFDKHRQHYFVCVGPQNEGDDVKITNLHPAEFPIEWMHEGAYVYNDWDSLLLKEIPRELFGHQLLTTIRGRAREAHLIGGFRKTRHPSSAKPDQVLLTWSEDPKTTQTVQWRTSIDIDRGTVRYKKTGETEYNEVSTQAELIENRLLANDPQCHHYTAVMRDLEPDTKYVYQVGHPKENVWSEGSEFTTAPDEERPFTFVTFGDTHIRDLWAEMMNVIEDRHPDIAFYAIAGDLVNTGQYRDDWDRFFYCTGSLGTKIPLVPTIGNHEVIDGMGVEMYVDVFGLPENGPATVMPERAFDFEYSNLHFISLDSTLPVIDQADWLDERLESSEKTWKFTMFHFPPYNYEEPYPEIRTLWGYLFDKHHVDFSLQGHIHYYMRSFPMFRDRAVASPDQGTVHVVSIPINNRVRELPPNDYAAVQFTGIPVYQLFEIDGNKLSYKVYDLDGNVLDEMTVHKTRVSQAR